MATESSIKNFSILTKRIFDEISKDVVGQKEVVKGAVIAMIAGGNVLLEGVPGVGKTRLVRTLGRVFNLPFSRIQFTPDLMPADVTGTNIVVEDEKGRANFCFKPGPVFSNIVLADEINRATPKTQSALLEAMQEHTVTVMGESHKLAEPFFVLATQNPIEQDGTYPLPEAQMDRFTFKIIVKSPDLEEMKSIIKMTQKTMEVLTYATIICLATHSDEEYSAEIAKKYVQTGASPRAGQALISTAKVHALMAGRYNVAYEDIDALVLPVLRHRIKLNFEAVADNIAPDEIILKILDEVKHGKLFKAVKSK